MKLRRTLEKAVRITGGAGARGTVDVNAAVVANAGERGTTRTRTSSRQRMMRRRDGTEIAEMHDVRSDG
jgi:hypothetical protein